MDKSVAFEKLSKKLTQLNVVWMTFPKINVSTG